MATLIKHNGEWVEVQSSNDNALPKAETMPASADVDTVLLYTGETNAYYTKGHTYQYKQTSLEPVAYGWVDISMNGVQPLFQVDLDGADPSSYSDTAIYQALTDGTTSDGVTVTKGHFYAVQENESSGDWEWTEVSLSSEVRANGVSYSNSSSGLSASNVQGAIDEVNTKVDNLPAPVTPKGTITFASLPSLANAEVGWMYNISDDFTTTSDFVISGISEKAGSNVYCIDTGSGVKKWDVFATGGETMVVDQTYDADSANAQSGTAVAEAVAGKVDKVTGKDLSTNDFTDDYKAIVDSVSIKEKALALESGCLITLRYKSTTPQFQDENVYTCTGLLTKDPSTTTTDINIYVKLKRGQIIIPKITEICRDGPVPAVGTLAGTLTIQLRRNSILNDLRTNLITDEKKAIFDEMFPTIATTAPTNKAEVCATNIFHGEPGAEFIAIPSIIYTQASSSTTTNIYNDRLTYQCGYVIYKVSESGVFRGSTEIIPETVAYKSKYAD